MEYLLALVGQTLLLRRELEACARTNKPIHPLRKILCRARNYTLFLLLVIFGIYQIPLFSIPPSQGETKKRTALDFKQRVIAIRNQHVEESIKAALDMLHVTFVVVCTYANCWR